MLQCPLCNYTNICKYATATDVEYFTTSGQFDFYECRNCEVLFIHPVPLKELAVIYPANYYSFTSKSKSIPFRIKNFIDTHFYKKILKKIPSKTLRVLDVGGGSGTLLDSIKNADKRVTHTQVVDIDAGAMALAEKKGHHYYCGTIENFEDPIPYDVILMLNLIEHVGDPTQVLTRAAGLLSVNGVIIIKTPNYKSLDSRIFKKTYWGGLHCPRHWILFTKNSFSNLAYECNLGVDQFTYTQGAPFWSFSILHWMNEHKWIRASKSNPLIYHPLFPILGVGFAVFDFLRKPFAPLSQMFFVLSKNQSQ